MNEFVWTLGALVAAAVIVPPFLGLCVKFCRMGWLRANFEYLVFISDQQTPTKPEQKQS